MHQTWQIPPVWNTQSVYRLTVYFIFDYTMKLSNGFQDCWPHWLYYNIIKHLHIFRGIQKQQACVVLCVLIIIFQVFDLLFAFFNGINIYSLQHHIILYKCNILVYSAELIIFSRGDGAKVKFVKENFPYWYFNWT